MTFDPTTAKLDDSFDPSTATPTTSGGFDPTTAKPYVKDEKAAWDKFAHGQPDKDNPNLWNVVGGLQGAYKQATSTGLLAQPVRTAMEVSGYGMDKVKKLYGPGKSEQFYKDKLHEHYNQALSGAREDSAKQIKDNPYPGQTVGNFLADAVGRPENLVLGGAGVGKNVATRIATAALSNAAVNSGSDAAAQGMDIAAGMKKDFDVQQNLEQAGAGAILGGGLHGVQEAAPVVSDFVKGLFKTRGVDTLPGATPGGITNPLTKGEVKFSPEEQSQFKQLLKTGSVDDIKGFFQGKNGVQPTFQDINKMVEFRDQMPEKFVGQEKFNQAVDQHLNDTHKSVVDDHIANETKEWKNAPSFETINSVDDIQDPEIRAKAAADDPDGDALGFYGADGKVRIYANRMESPEQLNAVLYHESLGHHGLAVKFGEKLDSTINTLLDRNVGSLGKETDQWVKENPGAYGGDRIRAAEEVLANKANNGKLKTSLYDAVTHNLRNFGRDMGMKLSYSDAEIAHILSMSHDAVIKGKTVAENGFRGSKAHPSGSRGWSALDREQAGLPQESGAVNKFMIKKSQMDPETRSEFEKWSEGTHPELLDESGEHKVIYHGSPYDIRAHEFKHNRINGKYETYATSDPSTAETYHHHEVSTQEYMDPKVVRESRNEYMKAQEFYTQKLHKTEPGSPERKKLEDWIASKYDKMQELTKSQTIATGGRTYPMHANFKNPRIVTELEGTKWSPSRWERNISEARLDGNDGVIFKGVRDHGSAGKGSDAGTSDVYVSLKPGQYKSASDYSKFKADSPKFMRKSDFRDKDDQAIRAVEQTYKAMEDREVTFRSHEETKSQAYQAGINPPDVAKLGKTPDLSKRIARLSGAAEIYDQRIADTLARLDTPDWSARDQDNLLQATVEHAYIINKLLDDHAEAGRALNIIRQFGYTKAKLESLSELMRDEGGSMAGLSNPETLLKFARTLKQNMGNGNALNSAVKSLSKPNWEDYVTTLHQNMMLSGLSTHVKSPLDMMIGIGRELMDSTATLPMSMAREAMRGMGMKVEPGTHPAEVIGRYTGILQAAMDAQTYIHTAKTLKNGGENAHGYGAKMNARIPVVSKVTDLITAQDAFFRAFATNMHLNGLSNRAAFDMLRKTGGKTDISTVLAHGANLRMNPSKELLKAATEAADTTLLLNKSKITEPLDRLKQTGPDSSGGRRFVAFIANFLTPFVRVGSNSLMTRIVKRSPLALLDVGTLKELKAGGPRADIAMARIIMGTASIAAYWAAAGEGKVTGSGPSNPSKVKEMMASGWRPKAVYENGQYNTGATLPMSFNPADPHNSTATTVASMREAYENGANKDNVASGILMATLSMMKELTEMSWVSDVAPAISTFTAPEASMKQKFAQFAGDEIGSMMPNIVSQSVRVNDQNKVDTLEPDSISGTIGNTLKSKLPVLRDELPVRQSVYGQPLKSGTSFAGEHTWMPQDNHVTGGNYVEESDDPTHQELDRLSSAMGKSALITPVQRSIKSPEDLSQFNPKQLSEDGSSVRLTNKQFEEYQQIAGEATVESVREEMSTPEWQQMSDQEKILLIKDIQKDMKKAAREQLYGN